MNKKKAEVEKQIVYGQPETVEELLHKYGTYVIQPTQDSENEFPKIAQGLPKKEKRE